jgi:intron-binding protein aquarius
MAGLFEEKPDEFSSMFRRVISLILDRTLATAVRTQLLSFLIYAFKSLDSGIIRKECAPLVSIGIWHNLSTEDVREAQLNQTTQLRKAWRAAMKRFDAADEAGKAKLRFERSWLYTLLLDFLNLLYEPKGQAGECHRIDKLLVSKPTVS